MSTDISTVIEIREDEHSPWREPTEDEWEPVPEPGLRDAPPELRRVWMPLRHEEPFLLYARC